MSVTTEKITVQGSMVVSRTCDRCGAETFVKNTRHGDHGIPYEQSANVSFEMRAGRALQMDSDFFDLSGDLCEGCIASFVEWFNSGDGPGWEKGKTWEQIKDESWTF